MMGEVKKGNDGVEEEKEKEEEEEEEKEEEEVVDMWSRTAGEQRLI